MGTQGKKPLAWLRRFLPILTVALLTVLIYDGLIFYSRWRREKDSQRRAAIEEQETARKTLEMIGDGKLKIARFYASPGVIQPGGRANVCYGVSGATKVRIEPAVEELKPSLNRCFSVSPARDTEYKLIAEDDSGNSVSERFILQVER